MDEEVRAPISGSGGAGILVNQAVEALTADEGPGPACRCRLRRGWLQGACEMWPAAVVVVEVVQELQPGSPVAEPAGAARGRHRLRLRRGGAIFGGEEAGAGVLKVDDDGRPVVTEVAEGSLAEEAGLEPGDVITDLGGYSSFSLDQLDQLRTVLAARRLITLGVRRGSEQLRLSVSLGDLAA